MGSVANWKGGGQTAKKCVGGVRSWLCLTLPIKPPPLPPSAPMPMLDVYIYQGIFLRWLWKPDKIPFIEIRLYQYIHQNIHLKSIYVEFTTKGRIFLFWRTSFSNKILQNVIKKICRKKSAETYWVETWFLYHLHVISSVNYWKRDYSVILFKIFLR